MLYESRNSGQLTVLPGAAFDGVKVFSATMFQQRDQLGEVVSAWIGANPAKRVSEFIVTQSSDAAFHCLTITVFYVEHR